MRPGLALRREPLTELTPAELGGVAGGEITVTCFCILHLLVREATEAATEVLPTARCGSDNTCA